MRRGNTEDKDEHEEFDNNAKIKSDKNSAQLSY